MGSEVCAASHSTGLFLLAQNDFCGHLVNYQSISLPTVKPELLLTSAPCEAPRCWEGIILMGRLRARPASIRTARLLNKATRAGFLLGHLTRSTCICFVLIIIDKLRRIMCGAGRGCSSSQLPVQPPPLADALGWICASDGAPGLFPPWEHVQLPNGSLNLSNTGVWVNGEEVTHWWLLWLQGPCSLLTPFQRAHPHLGWCLLIAGAAQGARRR